MILAGIDEAGYGPLLGPLVVGCCAFELGNVSADDAGAELPCVWRRLRKYVGKNKSANGKRLHVNDSKKVYSPSAGLRELERAVLAVVTAMDGWPAGLDAFVAKTAGHACDDLLEHPWYHRPTDEAWPIAQEETGVRLIANALRADMDRTASRCVHLAARVLPERQLNHMLEATRNKSNTLFSTAAVHLDHLIRNYADKGLVIFCDRQGGRAHYGHLLRLMFDEWTLEVTAETDGRSEYRLLRGGDSVRIIFCEKAEEQCLPVAMASMLSKYLREALMRRFNAYWLTHLPDLAPTAGYHPDGVRFLAAIDPTRKSMGIPDCDLVRSR